jgi:Ca2+-binding RTX toxin-like protein
VKFEIVAGVLQLKAGESLDFEATPTVTVEVTATDGGGLSITENVVVTVTNVNEGPGGGTALATWTPDEVETGRRRAQLFPEADVVDPEGDTLTYTVGTLPSAGALFLGNTKITVGQVLTEAQFHALTYRTPAPGTYNASFTVSDGVNTEPLNATITVHNPVNDTIVGTSAGEDLDGGAANDTVSGRGGDDSMWGGAGDDVVSGQAGDDRVQGNAGNDTLRGQGGVDTLLGSSGGDKLVGAAGDDRLVGASGRDTLRGGVGDDTLVGGRGKDKLAGGQGADDFVFKAGPQILNADTITDFVSRVDMLVLENQFFKGFGADVNRGELRFGVEALDANDHLLYDRATGRLFYDRDGSGDIERVLIARLDADTVLRYTDFDII